MKIAQIYKILDEIAPFSMQEEWDNSGLLLGNFEDNFDEIVLSIDLDSDLIEKAKNRTLFITHHPLIFKGIKKFSGDKFPTNLLKKMIKKDISLISMHTNYDICVLNKFVLNEILGFSEISSDGFILNFEVNQKFDDFAAFVKHKLGLENLRVVKTNDFIKTAAFCTGSGADLISKVKADCFLTGDLKYHTALECYENGLGLIDMGHFESERYFGQSLAKLLQKNKINAKITNSINPFQFF